MFPEYDYFHKVVILGDSGVGKSSLINRFVDNTYTDSYISTIGVDFKTKTIDVLGKAVKLQVWDTAGQERFRALDGKHRRMVQAVVIVFDVTDQVSFNNMKASWLPECQKKYGGPDKCTIILVGNKSDLEEKRQVDYETAQEFAKNLNLTYIETSAKNGANVDETFQTLSQEYLEREYPAGIPSSSSSEATFGRQFLKALDIAIQSLSSELASNIPFFKTTQKYDAHKALLALQEEGKIKSNTSQETIRMMLEEILSANKNIGSVSEVKSLLSMTKPKASMKGKGL